jgi:transposase
MQVCYTVCCGLDVHKKTVVACLRAPGQIGLRRSEVRTFATTTRALMQLADWLVANGCTHVAMESTGIYWRPVYQILEERQLSLLLVNAAHVKKVPGRKTDVKDCEWLAELPEHGLLRGSFVPPAPVRKLRELTRARRQLIDIHSQEANRLQKILETANIKLEATSPPTCSASLDEPCSAPSSPVSVTRTRWPPSHEAGCKTNAPPSRTRSTDISPTTTRS